MCLLYGIYTTHIYVHVVYRADMVGAAYFLCRRRPSHDSNFGGFSSAEGGVGGWKNKRNRKGDADELFLKAPLGHFTRKTVISLHHPRRQKPTYILYVYIIKHSCCIYLFIIFLRKRYVIHIYIYTFVCVCVCILHTRYSTVSHFEGGCLTHDPPMTISCAFTFWLMTRKALSVTIFRRRQPHRTRIRTYNIQAAGGRLSYTTAQHTRTCAVHTYNIIFISRLCVYVVKLRTRVSIIYHHFAYTILE